MRETYSPELVEAEVQAKWKAQDVYRAVEIGRASCRERV